MVGVNNNADTNLDKSTNGSLNTAVAPGPATRYLTTIGLEVHAQLLTKSKMFCGCSADIAYAPPNSHVCPICLGMPGTLPVINQEAVLLTVLTGLALNCTIPAFSKFDRKNYPYPDLMKGYQISQYDLPLCVEGHLEVDYTDERGNITRSAEIGIIRVHLEEDTARLLHRSDSGSAYTLMDVNRAGLPLMEIVSAPDLASPEEAQLYLMKLRHILRWIGASTGNMEEGSFRVDANVSVRPEGQAEFGTKVEIKNMNSFKAVRSALEYEVQRQTEVLRGGGSIDQETRGWIENRGITVSQRSKEAAHDYRYFPEPDLPPLTFTPGQISEIRASLPELPDERRERLAEEYGLTPYDALQITSSRPMADYFEKVATGLSKEGARTAAGLIVNNLARLLADRSVDITQTPVSSEQMAELVGLIENGTINRAVAVQLLPDITDDRSPAELVQERGLSIVRDESALEKSMDEAIEANPRAVADYVKGKDAAMMAIFGAVMKATKGQADPNATRELLKRRLDALREAQG